MMYNEWRWIVEEGSNYGAIHIDCVRWDETDYITETIEIYRNSWFQISTCRDPEGRPWMEPEISDPAIVELVYDFSDDPSGFGIWEFGTRKPGTSLIVLENENGNRILELEVTVR